MSRAGGTGAGGEGDGGPKAKVSGTGGLGAAGQGDGASGASGPEARVVEKAKVTFPSIV